MQGNVSKELYLFFNNLEPLVDKILLLLIQLPPYLTKKEGFESLGKMVKMLDTRFKYAIEFRDRSWFDDNVYAFLKNNKITLTWSVRDQLKTPPVVTSDQTYIRFIGDRNIDEKDFGKIVKDRKKEMGEYIDILNENVLESNQQNISIAFNNHFAGFGPESASTFLKMIDKPAVPDWTKEIKQNQKGNNFPKGNTLQTNLFDFSSFKTLK